MKIVIAKTQDELREACGKFLHLGMQHDIENIQELFDAAENAIDESMLDIDIREFMFMSMARRGDEILCAFKHRDTRDYLYIITGASPAVIVPVLKFSPFQTGEYFTARLARRNKQGV